ncbi:MAG: HNH endonuclease signature motif containing protein, partial [Microthrixaceae bacterium]
HVHHIVFWEHGGRTDMDNLIVLCPAHHGAIHRRGWRLTGSAAEPRFQRPGGATVPESAPPIQGSVAELVDRHRRDGLDIAVDGAGSGWMGDHIDWDCFFAAFAN